MSQSPILTFKVHRYSPVDMKETFLTENQHKFIEDQNKMLSSIETYQENGHITSDRRDSGFHTLTRSNDTTPMNETFNSNSIRNRMLNEDPLHQKYDNFITPNEQIRSSPLIFNRRRPSLNIETQNSTENAKTVAHNLFNFVGYDKNDVATHLSKEDPFSILVARKYMDLFYFDSINSLEEGLRTVLKKFPLVGETQERARILHRFSEAYSKSNPEFLDGNQDAVHALVFAIVLLNTDLHVGTGTRVGGRKRMSFKQFCSNLAGLEEQQIHFPTALLRDIYKSIKKQSLPWCEEPVLLNKVQSGLSGNINSSEITETDSQNTKRRRNKMIMRSQSMNKPSNSSKYRVHNFHDSVGKLTSHPGSRNNKTKTLPRKQGVLWRKSVVDSDGNKTIKRKRKWKLMMVALQGLDLHLAKKDSVDATKISLHHCLAEIEKTSNQATTRNHVFRVTLANDSAALYQASSALERKSWIDSINKNAALLSSAPLPAGIGSEHKFQKPLQPSSSSTLPLSKQLENHNERLTLLSTHLAEVREKLESEPSSQYHRDKSVFLEWEVKKYDIYVRSLREMTSSFLKPPTLSPLFNVKEEEEGEAVDSQSLLSVSPSEPGIHNNPGMSASSSTATVTDLSDSMGDLLNHPASKRQYSALRSPLSPTSSLPNLFPANARGTPPTSLGRHNAEFIYDLVPKVSETESGNSSIALVRSNDGSLNSNHSNNYVNENVSDFSTPTTSIASRIKVKGNPGYATTGRIEHKKCMLTSPEPARYSMAFLDTSVDVKQVANHVIPTPRPLALETSYLTNSLATLSEPRDQFCNTHRLHPDAATMGRNVNKNGRSSPLSVVSRMRGRKERKGTARYSYLQAVHDTTKE